MNICQHGWHCGKSHEAFKLGVDWDGCRGQIVGKMAKATPELPECGRRIEIQEMDKSKNA